MAMQFRKATKERAKARVAVFGPSGAGKTFSALRIAGGLGGPIAVIDTERGTASKYSDRFAFDVLDLEQRAIEHYCEAIKAAADGGYSVLIIDSLSHGWQELLAEVDKIAMAKFKGNTFSAWSEGTPKQRQLVEAILSFSGHVIATMRSKTEWTSETHNGRSRPVRVGLAPEQGKGIEYEFDLLIELSAEHVGTVIKDRSEKFQDQIIEKPGEEFGAALAEWLSDGEAPLDVNDVLRAIADAGDIPSLKGIAPKVDRLRGDAKTVAKEAGRLRMAELRKIEEAERLAAEKARRTEEEAFI